MFSNEDDSVVFAFLIGMIVLVMAGVALSLVVDRKFKFSNQANEIRQEINRNASEIEELESRKEVRDRQLSESSRQLRATSLAHQGNARELVALDQRKAKLEGARGELLSQIRALESGFSNYRSEYRRKAWERAVGEKLGDLVLSGSRRYQQAMIARVTDVGLEIRHENGFARIQSLDLAPELQDRFQWNDEARRQRLNEEVETLAGKADPAIVAKASKENRTLRVNVTEDTETPMALRQKVIAWNAKISKLHAEKREADSRARYGNQTSVPGGLEAWSSKAARLGSELASARAALAIAKSELAKVAPGDPLLMPIHRDF